jgi:translation initiation factor 2 beta subunit (eIF-2beta)/eIF-5
MSELTHILHVVTCPECGAISREVITDDLDVVLVCTDDECPRIIVSVLRVTA